MRQAARELDSAVRALADPSRRTILTLVQERPRAVGELAEQLPLTKQAVSHHLRVLRSARLVSERREGTRHLFVLDGDGAQALRDFIDAFLPSRLPPLKLAA